MTNNQAEWSALYFFVMSAPCGWEGRVYSDSKLIVNQFNDEWNTKDSILRKFYRITKQECRNKKLDIDLKWTPRESNLFGIYLDKLRENSKDSKWDKIHLLVE